MIYNDLQIKKKREKSFSYPEQSFNSKNKKNK